jgi:hypothetical protein
VARNDSDETYFGLTLKLTNDASQLEEAFRRAAFNIVFRNQDDHTKNFWLLLESPGRLAPRPSLRSQLCVWARHSIHASDALLRKGR